MGVPFNENMTWMIPNGMGISSVTYASEKFSHEE